MSNKAYKGKRKNVLTMSDMAALNAQEEKRIEAWAKENNIPATEARKRYFDKKWKEANTLPKRALKPEKLVIYSRRGTRVNSKKLCNECLTIHTTLWHYSRTSKGDIYLCTRCKNIALSRSRPKSVDALDLATTGGQFEGNRKKH